jgi:hypothetical protein
MPGLQQFVNASEPAFSLSIDHCWDGLSRTAP